MAEPATTAAGAAALASKIASAPAFFGAIAAAIVFVMTMPKTRKHQIIALAVTFLSSIYGGAFVLDYFDLQTLSDTARGAVYLICGMPAWVALRSFFSFVDGGGGEGMIKSAVKKWLA